MKNEEHGSADTAGQNLPGIERAKLIRAPHGKIRSLALRAIIPIQPVAIDISGS
jgi:hypothetical protein